VVATFQQAPHVLRTGTTFVTMELPLWPAHLVVSIGLFVTPLMMRLPATMK